MTKTEKIKELEEALIEASTVIDDWMHTDFPELCRKEKVSSSQCRINEYGELYYIASTQKKIKEALKHASPET